VVEDVTRSPIFAGTSELPVLLDAGVRALQSTPLVSSSGSLLGMISTHFDEPHRLSEAELRWMDLLARQGADFVERQRADKALRRAEEDLRDFVENASIGMHWLGPEGIILWANRTELEMLGYTADEYVGHHIAEFHVDRVAIQEILQRLARGEILPEYEARLRRKDGSIRDVTVNSNVLWEGGKLIHTRSFTRDVSDQKQAEQARATLAAIVESSDDAIVSKDLDGVIRSWNRGAERLFGYAAEEAVGRSITMLIPPDRLHEEQHVLSCIRRGESIGHYETVRRRKDGTFLDISLTVSPILGARGRIVGASKIARDITERKRTAALVASQKQAFEMAAAGAPLTQVLDSLAHAVESQSQQRAMVAIHLLNESGTRFEQTVAPSLPADYRRATDGMEVSSATGPFCMAVARRQPVAVADVEDSGEFPAFASFALPLGIRAGWSAPIVSSTGKVLGTVAHYYDEPREPHPQDNLVGEIVTRTAAIIIERKQAEQRQQHLFESARAAREEAERANRLKDEFLATLSHELRTPLNAIVGWTHILRDSARAETTQKAVEVIHRNAQVQNQLISDMLDVSSIIAGKLRLNARPVDLRRVIEAAVDTVRPAAEGRGIRVEPVLDPQAGPISGDPDRLQQVVWNLLSNAIKFVPAEQGRIRVRLDAVDSHVRVTVEDNGPGIDPEFLPHAFERFRQADSFGKRRHKGLGLGLAIVRHLVELHGGTVRADNREDGGGAVFTIELPRLSLAAEAAPPAIERHPSAEEAVWLESAPSLRGVRIVVVDDEIDARELLKTVLERCGAQVITCASAGEGLAALRRERPDVVVADIEMPEENGYELIREMRALPAEQGGLTPAAALTAHASAQDRMEALNAGFQIHVPKPVQPAELAAVVASLARKAGSGRPSRS
jgi:PAS domain S-box-containing protein